MSYPRFEVKLSSPDGDRLQSFDGRQPLWIGRDPDVDITIPGSIVSRRHVCVEPSPDGLKLTDSSSNGTLVDGLLLRRAVRVVGNQARLQLGGVELEVLLLLTAPVVAPELDMAPTEQRVELASRLPLAHTAPPLGAIAATPTHAPAAPPRRDVELRRRIQRKVLENLELSSLDRQKLDADVMRPRVLAALRRIVSELENGPTLATEREALVAELADEVLGLGPLERLLADADISEIMVVDPHTIFVERNGKMELSGLTFTDDDAVRSVIERIVTPLGRRIDESTPLVDARLKDGSRVNAVIPPLALKGPCITIRKFAKEPLRMADLVRFGSMTAPIARFLERAVAVKRNIIISGGTGSGKTTLLNVLSGAIPAGERIVTVEDAAELQLSQPHVVSLESRPPNLEGKGEYSIRDLVKNALRMRPDRIVVGECRGGEAIDMLAAMNTGHEGSLTTTHANSPREAVSRIETLCLMAGLDLPVRAIRMQIATSIHLIVQQSRFSDGSRRISRISEVIGMDDEGEVELRDIYSYHVLTAEQGSKITGRFEATGYLPTFLDRFVAAGYPIEDGFI